MRSITETTPGVVERIAEREKVQKWEYLMVKDRGADWGDSIGNKGKLEKLKLPDGGDWYNRGPLLNSLGEQGWELVGVGGDSLNNSANILFFKRPKISQNPQR